MANNLPLIPEKGHTSVCTDVKPVLRRVFQKWDILPPLAVEPQKLSEGQGDVINNNTWVEEFKTECNEINKIENELKQQFAHRLSRETLPNIYKLHHRSNKKIVYDSFKNEHGILERAHLLPSIIQNAEVDETLWVRNILHRSSGDLTSIPSKSSKLKVPLQYPTSKIYTDESWSLGEVMTVQPPAPPPLPQPPPQADHIVCIPPQLEFVNFVVGDHYEQQLQLVNVSKFEVRLSVRPPRRRELSIEMCASRGLIVTSGAAALFKIHFRPRDVLMVQDVFLVRVSTGKSLTVPIRCYMQPPILQIQVPAISASVFYSTPNESEAPVCQSTDILELGAKLLGDVHCAKLIFHCDAEHASFFLITEDAWVTFSLEELTSTGSTLAGSFVIWPSWWRGGGAVRGCAWCRADVTGLHVATLRIISSTAVVRPLHILADSLYFHHQHVTIEGHEKDFDICSEDDEACEYYVHLGTAFPQRSLASTVYLVNHSPITYSFYWSVRPWGVCSCSWEDESELGDVEETDMCVGALERIHREKLMGLDESESSPESMARRVHVEPARGAVAPRSSVPIHVSVPNAGDQPGTQRAVLMLVLKDIPLESFPNGYDPMIVKTTSVISERIPGVKGRSHTVADVVSGQMEVWWNVAPIRFVLDPPLLPIVYSRRVESVYISLRATLLYGADTIEGIFEAPPHVTIPKTILMNAANSYISDIQYSLPMLPNEHPEFDTITLTATNEEWKASCSTWRRCATRHPALRPPRVLLGVVPPAHSMHAVLHLLNDTHQHICWWGTAYRWQGERGPAAACEGRPPCPVCWERACSCAFLRPMRGALPHTHRQDIRYSVNAPDRDGIVATIVQVRRTGADVAHVSGGAGTAARASLLAYRVLAPRVLIRALPCYGDKHGEGCALDCGEKADSFGSACLRPARALALNLRTCYRLRFTNLTPIPTHISWDTPLGEDVLKVKFMPNSFEMDGYGQVEISVVLEALKVTGRRLFVYRAQVKHAYKPLYLLIDTAIAGLEIICEVPIGEEEKTQSKLIMKVSQREEFPWDVNKPKYNTPDEIFAENDRLRADKRCRCAYEMLYIPPETPPLDIQHDSSSPSVELVWEPPALTAVCACHPRGVPVLPQHEEAMCLQFKQIPLHTVRSRVITVRNPSVLTAKLKVAFRRYQRIHNRTIDKDKWSGDVREPGVIVQCTPSEGILPPRSTLDLRIDIYSDSWGLYREQLLIKVDNLLPIVLDVWIETVGSPLMFALTMPHVEVTPTVWFSSTDPDRTVRLKNVSRSALALCAYIATEHDYLQDELPFRLYIRFDDVLPRTCPCIEKYKDSLNRECTESEVSSSYVEEMDTIIELLLLPDFGIQNDEYFKVSPTCATVPAGAWHEWRVSLQVPPPEELAPHSIMIVSATPLDNAGPGWYRPSPPPQIARLRHAPRYTSLRLSCSEIMVKICAIDLPLHDVMRVRKTFRVCNVGTLALAVTAACEEPWCVVAAEPMSRCGPHCCCTLGHLQRQQHSPLHLMPKSSLEMSVEVKISTMSVWPKAEVNVCTPPVYEPFRRTLHHLTFYDENNIYMSLPLMTELEFPVIKVEPSLIDFGFVTDGDTRKSYFTVSHSSRSVALDMVADWVGPKEFRIQPTYFTLYPGRSERIYIQYMAVWCGAPVEGCMVAASACSARAWCRAGGRAAAAPARDVGAARLAHDHTDDPVLLPPDCEHLSPQRKLRSTINAPS